MIAIIFRTVIIYIILIISMRLMGKRQLGELDVSELVITILLSEIASSPIISPQGNILHAIISIAILVSFEIITSTIILKIPKAKDFLSSKPAVLIHRGKIDLKAMKKVRISIEELVSQTRQNGIFDLDEVDYAILEENGKMSIIPKSIYRQPDRQDLSIKDNNSGVMHIIISDGAINYRNLSLLNKSKDWIERNLNILSLKPSDVFCMTCNDANRLYIAKRDGTAVTLQAKN